MEHPERCPLCDQEKETINHLLAGCVFAHEFWYHFLKQVNLQILAPQQHVHRIIVSWSGGALAAKFRALQAMA